MEVSVIKIGNSKGIRLTKSIIEKYNIKNTLEVTLEKHHIVLKPVESVRKNWDQSFQKMHDNGDDKLLIEDVFEEEDNKVWN